MNRPWMPLYIADYLADTAHLNAAQSGAYLHLIMHYWQTGSLPDHDAALSRIARMSAAEWKRQRAILAGFFQDGWKHKRIDAELAHAEQVSSKRRAAAEQKHSKSSANGHAIAEQKHTHARASSQPQSHSEEGKPSSVARKRAHPIDPNWEPASEDIEYATSRGWTPSYAHSEAERFRNHFVASGSKKIDWRAAWRNWVTSPYQQTPKQGASNGARNPTMVAFDDLVTATAGGEGEANPPMRDITP